MKLCNLDNLQDGLNAADVKSEEAVWTSIINKYKDFDREWTADIVRGDGWIFDAHKYDVFWFVIEVVIAGTCPW